MDFFKNYFSSLTSFYSGGKIEEVYFAKLYSAPYDRAVVDACIEIAHEVCSCNILNMERIETSRTKILDAIRNNKNCCSTLEILNCLDYFSVDHDFIKSIEKHMKTFDRLSIDETRALSPAYSDNAKWGFWTWRLGDISNIPCPSENIVTPLLDMPAEFSFGFVFTVPKDRENLGVNIANNQFLEDVNDKYFIDWFSFFFSESNTYFSSGCCGEKYNFNIVLFYYDRPPKIVCSRNGPFDRDFIGFAVLFKGEYLFVTRKPWSCDKTFREKVYFTEFCRPENRWTISSGVTKSNIMKGHFGYRTQGGPFISLTENPTDRFDSVSEIREDCVVWDRDSDNSPNER